MANLKFMYATGLAGTATAELHPQVGRRWELLYGDLSATADATVTARNLLMRFTDTSPATARWFGPRLVSATVAATETKSLAFAQGMIGATQATSVTQISGIWIPYGGYIVLSLDGGQAGDTWQYHIVVREHPG